MEITAHRKERTYIAPEALEPFVQAWEASDTATRAALKDAITKLKPLAWGEYTHHELDREEIQTLREVISKLSALAGGEE